MRRLLVAVFAVAAIASATLVAACGDDHALPAPTGPSSFLGPRVTSVSPRTGASEAGTSVRILGSGFVPGATVTMDGAATNVVVVNSTTITATTPAHRAGVVPVAVTNPDGRSSTLPGAFTFVDLAVTNVAPISGLSGITVRINGTGFDTGAVVTMGGIAARTLSGNFSTIDVIAPDRNGGSADVIVTNPSGRSVTVTGGSRFTTVTFSLSASVVTAGGELTASWVVPDQNESSFVRGAEDAIGLWRVDTGKLIRWRDTTGTTSGTWTFNAPSEPGQYELQYQDFNELRTPYARIMGRIAITVTPAGTSGSRPHRP